MKHLIDINSLSKEEILNIINLAREFKNGTKSSDVEKKTLSLMFYENSTRTRCSFEIAGKKLGMNIINFDASHSSLCSPLALPLPHQESSQGKWSPFQPYTVLRTQSSKPRYPPQQF